ncbi:hypothetical protein LOAG_08029 [Loa loa]|uniref:G-protein coupled receptors family 1 profile domain-containing protein n=1 Tax=Loa loa TaxID=7209 RepID=A0A1S0TVB1_LOALO|nr:hypothetical protein LOAG_08029 [Loa loa]EFO20461.1 hypothetical protein LOAG_08029 [Loa loa]
MPENSEFEDNIVMACIFMIAVFGLISNGLSLYLTRTKSRFRNAFGILCSSFLICNLQAIFVLLTWCTIVLSFKSPILSSPKLFSVRLVGVFLNGGWFGALVMHFLIALNRFYAFVCAIKYNQLWSHSKTFKIIIISWSFSMVYCTHHLYKNCSYLFNYGSMYRWLHHTSFHGQICARIDAIVSIVLVVAMTFIDFITLVKILAYRRTMLTVSTGSAINEGEVLFFKQSCKLGLIYILCCITFNVPSYFTTDKWILFISSTIALLGTHSLDGLIFLVFHRKLISKTNFGGTSIAPNVNLNVFQTEQ